MKALEERLGTILIVRGQPCTPPAWAGSFAPLFDIQGTDLRSQKPPFVQLDLIAVAIISASRPIDGSI